MQAALSFGLQWEELAAIAVTALERWEAQQPKVLFMPRMPFAICQGG